MLAFAALTLQLLIAQPAEADRGHIGQLMQAAEALNVQAGGGAGGEADFKVALILDEIVKLYPTSPEAQTLARGASLPGSSINVAAVRLRAKSWAIRNQARARALVAGGVETLALVAPSLPGGRGAKTVRPPKAVVIDGSGTLRLPPRVQGQASARQAPVTQLPKNDQVAVLPPRSGQAAAAASSGAMEASSRQGVRRLLRRATVLIYFVELGARGVKTHPIGTGSFISPTHVLTNAHVAEAADRRQGTWLVINEEIGVRVAHVISNARRDTPLQIDAAVMEVQGYEHPVHLGLSQGAQVDEWIGIAGYPGDAAVLDARYDALAQALVSQRVPERYEIPSALVDEGRLNNIVPDKKKRALTLQYTMITAPGNSGSPIVNACGQMVGLHFAGYTTRVKYNIAEHTRQILIYLNMVGIPHTEATSRCTLGG